MNDAVDDDVNGVVEPRPMPSTRVIWWTALAWALGAAIVAAPIVGTLWTPNRDEAFWPLIATTFVLGALVGSTYRMSKERWAAKLSTLPPAIAFTVLYPVSCAVAIAVENISDDALDVGARLAVLAAGAAVASIGPLCRFVADDPRRAFLIATVVWALASLTLVPAYGVGLALIPLWVAYLTASRDPRFA